MMISNEIGPGMALLAGIAIGAAGVQQLHAQARAPAYIITEFEVIDDDAVREFAPKAPELVKASGGRYLIRGGQIIAPDGDAPKRFTVQAFDSPDPAQAFRASAEWNALTPLRQKALRQRSFIAEGVAN